MTVSLLKSKLHRARVTDRSLNYEGSLAIDLDLMERVGILPQERILVTNMANGQRFETYAIPAPRGSATFSLNGATARLGEPGDLLTIMAFGQYSPEETAGHQAKVITLGDGNRPLRPGA